MVTTTKKPSATTAAVKAAPSKTVASKPVAEKKDVAAPAAQPVAKAPVKAAVKAVAKAVPAPATVAVKPAAKKVGAPKTALKASTAPKPVLSTEQRNHYVSVAAFYIAERRGFTLGNPAVDWMEAEAEVDRLIASGHFTV